MLYLAISSCARPDSASASSANSVDSALASSARILLSIRSSAGTGAGRPGARGGGPLRRGGPGGAGQREELLQGGQMVERVQRLDRGGDGDDELRVAAERVPGAEIIRVAPPPGALPRRGRLERGRLGGPAVVHGGGRVAEQLGRDHVGHHRRVIGRQFPADVPGQLGRLPAALPGSGHRPAQVFDDGPADRLGPARRPLDRERVQVGAVRVPAAVADRLHGRSDRGGDEFLLRRGGTLVRRGRRRPPGRALRPAVPRLLRPPPTARLRHAK